ncbi:1-acyl-sn-glycerol-3-phosphate acyltransferase [Klenkia sp. LSe6-5]|uniref:1-acyl-sn-glycerol-3-phosphate acyltransferase n=1 Tax=Klenkia sesuvii TaxID=3103137 RepID=A0ABU8DV99_9ACTN
MSTGPCSTDCLADVAPTAPPGLRRRRAAALAVALARASARPPAGDGRRHAVCTSARLLTAAGVRVAVLPPTTAWPTGPVLVVANRVSWVDDLALRTAVPAVPEDDGAVWPGLPTVCAHQVADALTAGRSVLVRPEATASCGTELGRFRPGSLAPALAAGTPVCPVAVRARVGGRPTTVTAHLPGESWWRSAARVLGATDLVLEVQALPAIDPRRGTAAEVAALAEYAIAEVLEADPPRPISHPRRPRTHAAAVTTPAPSTAPAVSPRTHAPR